jgi:hypothetical protein
VPNSLNRFAVSSWMPFKYDPDGSLDLYFQNESPGADKDANWLPAAKGAVQPHHAPLCAKERCADRKMEPAAGDEVSRAHAVAGAITAVVARRRFQHLVSLRSLLGPVCLSPTECLSRIKKSQNIEFWKKPRHCGVKLGGGIASRFGEKGQNVVGRHLPRSGVPFWGW